MSVAHFTLGPMQGLLIADHAIAPNWKVVRSKHCEHCGRLMFIDFSRRYCFACQRAGLVPIDMAEYKDQFPGTAQQMRHSLHLVKYDSTCRCEGECTCRMPHD